MVTDAMRPYPIVSVPYVSDSRSFGSRGELARSTYSFEYPLDITWCPQSLHTSES